MKVGFGLPQMGPAASLDAVVKAAQRAEELGYDSVWVVERLLYPLKPQTPYPATPDGSLPDIYKRVLDPLATLTFLAAKTSRVGLGTSVLDMPYYNPAMLARQLTTLDVLSQDYNPAMLARQLTTLDVLSQDYNPAMLARQLTTLDVLSQDYNPAMLARQLTTLDVLSQGRLRLGLGLGWSKDEYDAVGATFKGRGARADEFIHVLKAIWTTDPVEFQGKFYHIPKSIIQPKPVQKPHPPIYLASFSEAALKRVAKLADGWNPVGIPVDGMGQMFQEVKEMAKAEGRDPSSLRLLVRAHPDITEKPLGKDRWAFAGTLDQIKEDISRCRDLAVEELFFDPIFSPDGQSLDRFLSRMEQMRGLV